jgi:single-strand DNA-binding protein
MSRGINKVILIGNIGKDADIRHFSDGGAVVNFSIATTSSVKDKSTGAFTDKTEWHKVVIYGKLATSIQQYLIKGTKIYIEGSLRTRKWTDQKQVDHYTTEVIASKLEVLSHLISSNAPAITAHQAPEPSHQPQDTYSYTVDNNPSLYEPPF